MYLRDDSGIDDGSGGDSSSTVGTALQFLISYYFDFFTRGNEDDEHDGGSLAVGCGRLRNRRIQKLGCSRHVF
jgi:hypothetical protein